MKKFFWDRRKWSPLAIYFVFALVFWAKRTTLIYAHLPIWFSAILYDLIFASLVFFGFACVVREIRCPFITKAKVDRAFDQAGVMNKLGQHPVLVAVDENISKKHTKRYTVRNFGVPVSDMEARIDSLQQELGVIYKILDTPKPGFTYLYVLPGRSSLPTVTPTADDDEF